MCPKITQSTSNKNSTAAAAASLQSCPTLCDPIDTERSTLHRQCEPLQRVNVAVKCSVVASFYRLGNFIC